MEKKTSLSDKPMKVKIIYGVVIAMLVISAIVIGIVSAASRSKDDQPPISDGSEGGTPDDGNGGGNGENDNNGGNGETGDNENNGGNENGDNTPKPLALVSPVVGTVMTEHDMSTPVFSLTLGEWRVHAGVDIATEEGAAVYAAEDGVISAIYTDPRYGYTIEITHRGDVKTRYSNLKADEAISIHVGDSITSGDRIGTVGDTARNEIAEEAHLHFEMLVDGKKVDPLDHLTKESLESSLGIKQDDNAA